MDDLTAVQLNDEEAKKFILFMQYYDKIKVLLDAGVFEQKKATIALNIDHNGNIKSIQRADFLFTSKFDKL